uniref:Signal recognition particle subunit SRP72 n=1 Tax=Anisakis simplex TaxID=6269 RepID=A0A0M3KBF0_ANISI
LDLLSKAIAEAKEDSMLGGVLEQTATLNIHLGDYQSAVECLERLSALKPNDMQILCRLIKAYSAFDAKRAEELTNRVFPPKNTSEEVVTGKLRKRKRKRKVILPKNYDPKVPPDPERWLPKQERTAYKKKLNKRHKDREIGRGTQGTTAASPQL